MPRSSSPDLPADHAPSPRSLPFGGTSAPSLPAMAPLTSASSVGNVAMSSGNSSDEGASFGSRNGGGSTFYARHEYRREDSQSKEDSLKKNEQEFMNL